MGCERTLIFPFSKNSLTMEEVCGLVLWLLRKNEISSYFFKYGPIMESEEIEQLVQMKPVLKLASDALDMCNWKKERIAYTQVLIQKIDRTSEIESTKEEWRVDKQLIFQVTRVPLDVIEQTEKSLK